MIYSSSAQKSFYIFVNPCHLPCIPSTFTIPILQCRGGTTISAHHVPSPNRAQIYSDTICSAAFLTVTEQQDIFTELNTIDLSSHCRTVSYCKGHHTSCKSPTVHYLHLAHNFIDFDRYIMRDGNINRHLNSSPLPTTPLSTNCPESKWLG